MKIKQRPEDFSVIESYRFKEDARGAYFVYRMDKQKLSTLEAVERLRERFRVKRTDVSFCGLKDKQGRTEQLIAVHNKQVELQDPDLKLTFLGRTAEALSAKNITSNRFSVIVRDLSEEEAERVAESAAEVARVGIVNYFDSQRFGFVKHGQGFIAKDLLRGDLQAALKALIAKPSELDRTEDAKVKKWFAEHWGEWKLHPPYQSWVKYRPIIERLRENPRDFGGALLAVDRRLRMMVVFEYQSALWNDSVRRYLRKKLSERDTVTLLYQLGALLFPRALSPELAREFKHKTFPLIARGAPLPDPEIRAAVEATLSQEHLNLEDLEVTKMEAFHFKYEERPLFIFPGKLRSSAPQPDEANRGRQKVVMSFTLPPGAYATLVVRRVLWYAMNETHQAPVRGQRREPAPVPKIAPATPKEAPAPPTPKKGFLERQRERKQTKAAARESKAPRK